MYMLPKLKTKNKKQQLSFSYPLKLLFPKSSYLHYMFLYIYPISSTPYPQVSGSLPLSILHTTNNPYHSHYHHSNLKLHLFLTNLQTSTFLFFQSNPDTDITANLTEHLYQGDPCSKSLFTAHLLWDKSMYSGSYNSFIHPCTWQTLLKSYYVSDIHLGTWNFVVYKTKVTAVWNFRSNGKT